MEEKETVVIDDVEYALEDLNDNSKYALKQMAVLRDSIQQKRESIDREQMSYNAYAAILNAELSGEGE